MYYQVLENHKTRTRSVHTVASSACIQGRELGEGISGLAHWRNCCLGGWRLRGQYEVNISNLSILRQLFNQWNSIKTVIHYFTSIIIDASCCIITPLFNIKWKILTFRLIACIPIHMPVYVYIYVCMYIHIYIYTQCMSINVYILFAQQVHEPMFQHIVQSATCPSNGLIFTNCLQWFRYLIIN